MLHLQGNNCIYCDRELKTLREFWTSVCLICADGGDDEEDLDPYLGCDMTPDPNGKTTGDISDY